MESNLTLATLTPPCQLCTTIGQLSLSGALREQGQPRDRQLTGPLDTRRQSIFHQQDPYRDTVNFNVIHPINMHEREIIKKIYLSIEKKTLLLCLHIPHIISNMSPFPQIISKGNFLS